MRVSSAKLRRFVLRVLRQTPIPPRPVGYGAVLGTVLRSTLGLIAALFGAFPIVGALGAVFVAHGQIAAYVFAAGFLVFGAFVIAIPFWYAMRVRRALTTHKLCGDLEDRVEQIFCSSLTLTVHRSPILRPPGSRSKECLLVRSCLRQSPARPMPRQVTARIEKPSKMSQMCTESCA